MPGSDARRRAAAASERGHVLTGLSAANDQSWTERGSHGKWSWLWAGLATETRRPQRAAILQELHVTAHGIPGMGMLGQVAETELSAGEAISGGSLQARPARRQHEP